MVPFLCGSSFSRGGRGCRAAAKSRSNAFTVGGTNGLVSRLEFRLYCFEGEAHTGRNSSSSRVHVLSSQYFQKVCWDRRTILAFAAEDEPSSGDGEGDHDDTPMRTDMRAISVS